MLRGHCQADKDCEEGKMVVAGNGEEKKSKVKFYVCITVFPKWVTETGTYVGQIVL